MSVSMQLHIKYYIENRSSYSIPCKKNKLNEKLNKKLNKKLLVVSVVFVCTMIFSRKDPYYELVT